MRTARFVPHLRAGITLVELLVVLTVISIILALALPALNRVREQSRRIHCVSNLRQIGIALARYHDVHQCFPWGAGVGDMLDETKPRRRFSAHAMLLPFLGYQHVYNAINFEVPPFHPDPFWNASRTALAGPNATAALAKIEVFICPSDSGVRKMDERGLHPWGHTNYRSCQGSNMDIFRGNGLFGTALVHSYRDVVDGTAFTAAFSEKLVGDDNPERISLLRDLFFNGQDHGDADGLRRWCRSVDPFSDPRVQHDSDTGQNWLEANMNWTRYNHVDTPNQKSCKNRWLTSFGAMMTATSAHTGGVNVLFADGHVAFVSETIDLGIWRAFGTHGGGEGIPADADQYVQQF